MEADTRTWIPVPRAPADRSDGDAPDAARRSARGSRREPEIVLDLSRLLSRLSFSAPTGVDRVEMAYARRLLEIAPHRVSFAAVNPMGVYGRLPTPACAAFLDETRKIWSGDKAPAGPVARTLSTLLRLRPRRLREPIAAELRPRVYLLTSPHHLDQPRAIRRILARERARFVCLVHDLIPLDYPEYARADGPSRHARRMDTLAQFADGVVAGSDAVRRSFLARLAREGRTMRVAVAPLGADPLVPAPIPQTPAAPPYFVCVGTIEPRKNHLLLLNLWRRFAEQAPRAEIPRLILIGRRGWENENILDMLERCPGLSGLVEERGQAPDAEMWSLIRGARAVLMPSFAEGFGLPVIEALQRGTPVLCSDLPAHREIAAGVAEFLDPLDGPGWRQAILDYAQADSARRDAQLRRLAAWRAPTWDAHVAAALDLIEEVSQ